MDTLFPSRMEGVIAALNRKFIWEPRSVVSSLHSRQEQKGSALVSSDCSDLVFASEADEGIVMVKEARNRGIGFSPCPLTSDGTLLALYSKGMKPEELFSLRESGRKVIAIVGTRDASEYGIAQTHAIVEDLARRGDNPVILSGLALGIDVHAHEAALENGLGTVAVLPCGLDSVYPSRHGAIAERIARTPGCSLLSPFPIGTPPDAALFLRRNAVMAELADEVILVESRIKGSGLHTARVAHSIGRKVFAVPGRIGDIRSEGCNELIRQGVAELYDYNNFNQ